MAASSRNMNFDLVLRNFARALLWTLAGFGAVVLMLLLVLGWSGILAW